MTKYPYVRAWGLMLGSSPFYIEHEIEMAGIDGAPPTAIFRRHNEDHWTTFEEVTSQETRRAMLELMAGWNIEEVKSS